MLLLFYNVTVHISLKYMGVHEILRRSNANLHITLIILKFSSKDH